MDKINNKEGISMDSGLNEEFMGIVQEERKEVKREKFDLDSAINVIKKLKEEGVIGPEDGIDKILEVLNDRYSRISDI